MAADSLPSTLSFLTDAAHLLISASPETSAHLMSQRNLLMFNNDIDQPDVQRQHVCGCCGHIMVAGLGDVLKMNKRKTTRHTRRATSKKEKAEDQYQSSLRGNGCRKTLTCSNCGRYTKIDVPPPARMAKRRFKHISRSATTTAAAGLAKVAMPTTTTTTTMKATNSHAPSPVTVPSESAKGSGSGSGSANASSKKRAKSRKQGLQALLQQQSMNSKSQPGLGLSLADFMQN
ncbi:hypothetical protein F4808DRAFT_238113 [Astrocystis sublimbata]|nr:hypothetical protein F4808DRAFT_238113 [Astrocystis sublimbata]